MANLPLSRPYSGPITPAVRPGLLQRFFAVWRQRQHLDRLPPHMRRDIGLSDTDIAHEMQRPIWDVPSTWRE